MRESGELSIGRLIGWYKPSTKPLKSPHHGLNQASTHVKDSASNQNSPESTPEAKRRVTNYQKRYRLPAPTGSYTRKGAAKGRKEADENVQRNAHRESVSLTSGDMKKIWRILKWTKDRADKYRSLMPTLVAGGRSYTKIEEKAKILGESFHPTPPETDTTDIESYEYPLPIRAEPITETETARVIHRVGADKAPGPDGIINRILQLASQTITPILCKIFNACLATGYCPKTLPRFKDSCAP